MSVQKRMSMLGCTALTVALAAVGLAPIAQAGPPPRSLTPALASAALSPPSKALPAALDVKTPYQAQVSCDPRPKPGVAAFAALMKARYKTGYVGTYRPCLGDISEHYDGRAMDWMLNVNNLGQRAIANSVTAWLSANGGQMARRLGVSYLIWNRRMWREYAPERGWTRYTGAVPHTDHIHITFSWNGAMKRTSWWSGRATTVVDVGPCKVYAGQFAPLYKSVRTAACPSRLATAPASSYRVAVYGQRSTQIATAQRRLGMRADGLFGWSTFSKLVAWQARAGVPVTGALDKATWVKLMRGAVVAVVKVPSTTSAVAAGSAAATRYTAYKRVVLRQGSKGAAVKVLQRALKAAADGGFGSTTRAAVVAFQTRQGITRDGVVGVQVWNRLEKRDYPLIAYRRVVLRQGSKGAGVVIVQRALRLPTDGGFGPKTVAAVKALQVKAKLGATGVVSGWTWVALENRWRLL